MKNYRRMFLFCAILLSGFFVFIAGAWAFTDHVVISQLQVQGDGGANDEFIEIFNPTDQAVSLQGWSLQYKSATGDFPLSSGKKNFPAEVLQPQSYYLIANNGYNWEVLADISHNTFSLSASAGGATVFLSSSDEYVVSGDDSNIIDKLGYGDSVSNSPEGLPALVPEAEKALFRTQETNNNLADFTIQDSNPRNSFFLATTTPEHPASSSPESAATTTPDTTASSTPEILASSTPEQLIESLLVKILRFLPNPLGADSGNEWVELTNQDEKEVLLEGWLLDDESADGKPGSSAFILSGTIASGETMRFTLPEGAFALNNSGGDEVNLYFSDSTLAQRAVYTATAYDDGIFELRDGQWQPPVISPPASSGSLSGGGSSSYISYAPTAPVKISEIFANPSGDDPGNEWVEIYNDGNATTSLEGYFLADGSSDSWSSAAWSIPKDLIISPYGYTAIFLPKESLTLNNSGQEKVKLFSSAKQLLDSVVYEDAPENQSYSKNQKGEWSFGLPTPGAENFEGLPEYPLLISEVLPNPSGNGEEFVEIFNNATSTVDIKGLILQIGSRSKVLEEATEVEPKGYFVFYEDDLPVRLSNNGQTIILKDAFGRELDGVVYTKAKAGEAYALLENGKYSWTQNPSPKEENIFILGETESLAVEPSSASSKTSSQAKEPNLSQIYGVTLEINRQLNEKIQNLETQIAGLSQTLASMGQIQLARAEVAEQAAEQPVSKATNPLFYLLLALLALALFAVLIRWFLRSKEAGLVK